MKKIFKETITIDHSQTKADHTYLETNNNLGEEHQVNKRNKISQTAPSLPTKTIPYPRVDNPPPGLDKPIQQPQTKNKKQ